MSMVELENALVGEKKNTALQMIAELEQMGADQHSVVYGLVGVFHRRFTHEAAFSILIFKEFDALNKNKTCFLTGFQFSTQGSYFGTCLI